MSWLDSSCASRLPSGWIARSLRRKPSVNHCAKYENSTVDFGDSMNVSRVNSPSRSSTFGSFGRRAARGQVATAERPVGQRRPRRVVGLRRERVAACATFWIARLVSALLTALRTGATASMAFQIGSPFVVRTSSRRLRARPSRCFSCLAWAQATDGHRGVRILAARRCTLRVVRRYVVLCALVCASLSFALPAAAKVRDCPDSPRDTVFQVSARNMSCAVALRHIRRVRYVGSRNPYQPRLAGWRCRIVTTLSDGVSYRCSRRAQAFRWYRGG